MRNRIFLWIEGLPPQALLLIGATVLIAVGQLAKHLPHVTGYH